MQGGKEPIDYIKNPIKKIAANEASVGLILFLSAVAAIIVANSSLGNWYHHLWETPMEISFGERRFGMTFHHLINDGLMAIFFFMVGLEIKREFLLGSLNSWRKASLPIGAAIGGMLVPALIYLYFNEGEAAEGWGIPMATDIAFTLGLINLVSKRVAKSLVVFVTSLAVVDDMGAVLVIAFFYTSEIHLEQIYYAFGVLALLFLARGLGVRSVLFYVTVGIIGIWSAFFYAGIHATIAGILLAMTIPANTKVTRSRFLRTASVLIRRFNRTDSLAEKYNSTNEDHLLEEMEHLGDQARSPMQKIESGLHDFVYFIVMPLFAFANAGVKLEGGIDTITGSTVAVGVMMGLVLGKVIGISSFSWILYKLGIAELPKGANWYQIIGVACLAGIGFTMSLFIAELAFSSKQLISEAKLAVLVGSAIAGIIGLGLLRFSKVQN